MRADQPASNPPPNALANALNSTLRSTDAPRHRRALAMLLGPFGGTGSRWGTAICPAPTAPAAPAAPRTA